ncbi:hypothetical protein [Niveibacterium sp. COAC-50]|uniref:hypothetical protein n=1 Tax=Niveibacterium sp. COAC-50 TaxID=2729384 RepID=UPI001555A03E|nr:hypothetical protein [Niveibacterium sp. COAC-50]
MTPTHITHYHLADRRPFLNLSDLADDALQQVLDELNARRSADAGYQRFFGRRYMQLRRLTEARMRELFVAAGGRPERQSPHYFVLGSSEWFRRLAADTRAITLALNTLPADQLSFTYPDSFTAMGFGPQFGLPHVARPYHGQVFRLEALAEVVAQYGLPADEPDAGHADYHLKPFEKYIEVQLWSDAPIASLLQQVETLARVQV